MINMPSLYTETLGKLLENQHYGEQTQSAPLTEILNLMKYFPKFIVEENVELDFTQLFIEKYDIREIGAETEELFMHFWKERTNELLIKYKYKIEMWASKFQELFDFKITLNISKSKEHERTISNEFENTTDNTYYLNPINKTTADLKIQDADKIEDNSSSSRTDNYTNTENNILEVPQAVWGKTRPYIMGQILDLKDIYIECLDDFEDLFMGVY